MTEEGGIISGSIPEISSLSVSVSGSNVLRAIVLYGYCSPYAKTTQFLLLYLVTPPISNVSTRFFPSQRTRNEILTLIQPTIQQGVP